MSLCGSRSLVKDDGAKIIAATLKCRSWRCDSCNPMRVAQLRRLAMSGHPMTFITLTVNPHNFDSPEDRARRLADAWRKTVKAACRKYQYKTIEFLAVFEKTKAGEPHLHILSRVKWLDQGWLSARMNEYIGAPIVDIRRIDNAGRAAAYISKYLGKDPHQFGTCKRYWTSRNWDMEQDKQDDCVKAFTAPWEIRDARLSELCRRWVNEFRSVKFIRSDLAEVGPKYSAWWMKPCLSSG